MTVRDIRPCRVCAAAGLWNYELAPTQFLYARTRSPYTYQQIRLVSRPKSSKIPQFGNQQPLCCKFVAKFLPYLAPNNVFFYLFFFIIIQHLRSAPSLV